MEIHLQATYGKVKASDRMIPTTYTQTRDNNALHTETSEASSQVSVRVMNILFEKIADSLSTVIG